jgi:hypothetical protein
VVACTEPRLPLLLDHGRGKRWSSFNPCHHVTFVIGESRGLAKVSAIFANFAVILVFILAVGESIFLTLYLIKKKEIFI